MADKSLVKGNLEAFAKYLKDRYGIFELPILPFAGVAILAFVALFSVSPRLGVLAVEWLFTLYPIWLPLILYPMAREAWKSSHQSLFISKQEHTVLELRMPREVTKSPLAMETVFAGLHQGPGEGTWYDRFVKGQVRPWFSFEITNLNGRIRFFIQTRARFVPLVRAQLYAQYPDIEISEAEDYAMCTDCSLTKTNIWGCNFTTNASHVLPIRTYRDYALEKDPKEEFKIDPFSNLLEFLGTLGPGEQLWIQFIIRVHKLEKYEGKKTADGKDYGYKDKAKEEIKQIAEKGYLKGADDEKAGAALRLSKGQNETIEAIERKMGKQLFDVGIRAVYVAEQAKYNGFVISGITAMFKQFSHENLNGFKPISGLAKFAGYPWEDIGGKRKDKAKEEIVDAYRQRGYFHGDYADEYAVMSTEELATLYHPPSSTVRTPALSRIASTTADAPPNLPI